MKEKFTEQDGILFMECNPKPLEKNSQVPCLIRPIQDNTRMGELNRTSFKYGLEKFVLYNIENYIGDGFYLRFEIVAKHCLEGSVEWALWQMLNGKIVQKTNKYKICNNDVCAYYQGLSDSWNIIYPIEIWLTTAARSGWQIYEEPNLKPEVGKWYKHTDFHEHLLCEQVFNYRAKFRKCGTFNYVSVYEVNYGGLILSPIEPDFSNAKEGDKCYSVLVGDMEISYVFNNQEDWGIKAYHEKSGLSAYYTVSGIYDRHHIHPALFNSVEQCAAYFAEVARKERGKQ